jgi:hypothetical protein
MWIMLPCRLIAYIILIQLPLHNPLALTFHLRWSLTELETSYISKFNLATLYNFSLIAVINLGYIHTDETKLKISKPGKLNPMYGKSHSEEAKAIMRERRNKYPLGGGLFNLEGNLISKFKNNVELAKHLNISKVTVGKYLTSNIIYNNFYYFKPIND